MRVPESRVQSAEPESQTERAQRVCEAYLDQVSRPWISVAGLM